MRNATRVTVSTFGVLAGVAGIEHGIGEILQGNVAPGGVMILSWPGPGLFDVLAGEPAMTLIPNPLISGILSILLSLIFLLWVILFVQRKRGGLVLIGLSFALLLVGGGFGPPLLGLILGAVATKMHAPPAWWRSHLSSGSRRFLSTLWAWSLGADVLAWLFLFPGTIILDYLGGMNNPELIVSMTTLSAFALLLLTIVAGFAYDIQSQSGSTPTVLDEGPRPAMR